MSILVIVSIALVPFRPCIGIYDRIVPAAMIYVIRIQQNVVFHLLLLLTGKLIYVYLSPL